MINRIMSMLIITAFILMTGMISGPTRGDQISNTILISAASGGFFEGLLAVKEADGVFVVRSKDGKKKRFTLNKNTTITRNGTPASYSDLRSQDRVRVHYNSKFVVTEIQASVP